MADYYCHLCGERCGMMGHLDLKTNTYKCQMKENKVSDRLTELAQLQSRVRELTQEVGPEIKARMKAIVVEMNALADEGRQLADNSGLEFSLSGLNFLSSRYEDLSYRPNEGKFEDWNSSSAYC